MGAGRLRHLLPAGHAGELVDALVVAHLPDVGAGPPPAGLLTDHEVALGEGGIARWIWGGRHEWDTNCQRRWGTGEVTMFPATLLERVGLGLSAGGEGDDFEAGAVGDGGLLVIGGGESLAVEFDDDGFLVEAEGGEEGGDGGLGG